jgi:DNA-binding transcriptional MerR regulator
MDTTTGYRIAELAERSGFSSATVRYYEQVGVLPAPTRTDSGYRMYAERDFERLVFVRRAKQLGCSLEEITRLMSAWDADCGDVQAQLRGIVADKIATARRQTADLVAFTAQLQQAAGTLAGHSTDGPCDDDCACVADPGPGPTRVELAPQPAHPALGDEPPIVCTLGADQMDGRVTEWQAVLTQVVDRQAIEGGVRLQFPTSPGLAATIADLAEREHGCCSFFDFAVRISAAGLSLDVRAPEAAADLVAALFGPES